MFGAKVLKEIDVNTNTNVTIQKHSVNSNTAVTKQDILEIF